MYKLDALSCIRNPVWSSQISSIEDGHKSSGTCLSEVLATVEE